MTVYYITMGALSVLIAWIVVKVLFYRYDQAE